MSESHRVALAVVAMVLTAIPLSANWNRTALLIDAPTADVLPPGAMVFTLDGTQRFLARAPLPGAEGDFAIRFGALNRLELSLSAYTLKDYALGASYQLLGREGRPCLAAGIHDIGISGYVGELGHDSTQFPDELYSNRAAEIGSAFVVGTLPVGRLGRVHLGLGRGRYVGHDTGRHLHTDLFFGSDTLLFQWTIGLFGGAELNVGSHVKLVAEADGRDGNVGVKTQFGPLGANLALTKIEGFTDKRYFQRIAVAVSYQADHIFQRRRPRKGPPPPPIFSSLEITVLDAATREPLPDAELRVSPGGAPEPITEPGVTTNSAGMFTIDGIAAGTYLVEAEKADYQDKKQEATVAPGERAVVEILLERSTGIATPPPPLAGPMLHLVPIYFGWDSSNISVQSARVLQEHASFLKENANIKITIVGNCDETGSDAYNLKLGMRRAVAACDFLRSLGVADERMKLVSAGEIKSLPGEPSKHWKNRRCEFIPKVP